jgi:thiamine transporter ThiT
MPNESWRTSAHGRGDASSRFNTPQVYDQDDNVRERMTVTKVVGVIVTFVLGLVAGLSFFSFFVYHGLNALGVNVSWIDSLVASLCFIAVRYFDLGISTRLRKRD